jgi:hypothetical protein
LSEISFHIISNTSGSFQNIKLRYAWNQNDNQNFLPRQDFLEYKFVAAATKFEKHECQRLTEASDVQDNKYFPKRGHF